MLARLRLTPNPTVHRAVDGTLTAILGREAVLSGVRLTMNDAADCACLAPSSQQV